mmetsp:Transcript_106735/g.283954  ORF Transcript_106735/g.283954 Transcript_106735/m.283954 type:complete len:247 (+) Transcript_106735:489-1229(+)
MVVGVGKRHHLERLLHLAAVRHAVVLGVPGREGVPDLHLVVLHQRVEEAVAAHDRLDLVTAPPLAVRPRPCLSSLIGAVLETEELNQPLKVLEEGVLELESGHADGPLVLFELDGTENGDPAQDQRQHVVHVEEPGRPREGVEYPLDSLLHDCADVDHDEGGRDDRLEVREQAADPNVGLRVQQAPSAPLRVAPHGQSPLQLRQPRALRLAQARAVAPPEPAAPLPAGRRRAPQHLHALPVEDLQR